MAGSPHRHRKFAAEAAVLCSHPGGPAVWQVWAQGPGIPGQQGQVEYANKMNVPSFRGTQGGWAHGEGLRV